MDAVVESGSVCLLLSVGRRAALSPSQRRERHRRRVVLEAFLTTLTSFLSSGASKRAPNLRTTCRVVRISLMTTRVSVCSTSEQVLRVNRSRRDGAAGDQGPQKLESRFPSAGALLVTSTTSCSASIGRQADARSGFRARCSRICFGRFFGRSFRQTPTSSARSRRRSLFPNSAPLAMAAREPAPRCSLSSRLTRTCRGDSPPARHERPPDRQASDAEER